MNKHVGLICEGGGTKTAYTSGVLQCFLDQKIYFPYCVGISAGAENLLAYVSRHPNRLRVTGIESASQKGAVGLSPLLHERGVFGIEATCKYIEDHAPLDYEMFEKSESLLDMGVYNMKSNQVEYFDKSYYNKDDQTLVKAACALFLLTRPFKFNHGSYMDAGLIDMIPIEQSIRQGNKKHVFISTKEAAYVRKAAPTWQLWFSSLFYPGNKKIKENLKIRHDNYNRQWNIVQQLEKEGKALVLRPSADYGVTRYTTDRKKLEEWYELGYQDTLDRIEMINVFINE